jgi:tetratricopeptide (TPR) repeat protein
LTGNTAWLTELNKIPESITMYQQAIKIKPTYMAYSNLGTAYARAGRYEDAVTAYRGALAIESSDWPAWCNLAYVLHWSTPESREVLDERDKAVEITLRSLEFGYTRQQLRRNAELTNLLEDPRMAKSR